MTDEFKKKMFAYAKRLSELCRADAKYVDAKQVSTTIITALDECNSQDKAESNPTTPNTGILEISEFLKEYIIDASDHGIVDAKYYHDKLDAVVAKLQ